MNTTSGRGWIGRMRDRQQVAGAVAARPMYAAKRESMPAAARLAVVFEVFGVTGRERDVVAARLAGATFGEVAAAGRVTRQRVQQLERAALDRLGLSGSVEQIVHADQRADGAGAMRGRAAAAAGLVAGTGTWVPLTRADRAHERAVARFLKARGVAA